MKFSELWLRERVNTTLDSKAFFNQITMAGLEVDNVEPVEITSKGVIVGEIIECTKHPKNDRLYVTKVNIGEKRLLYIICDAPNCRRQIKVAVATVGAVLPDNFKITAVKLFDEPSEGKLCSFSDLGISDDHINIIELPDNLSIGEDIREYFKLYDNTIEISITPNRADCLSIIGIARDIAALSQSKFNEIKITRVVSTINDTLSIQIDEPEACPRYLGRLIKGINVKAPTPLWMKEKLRRCNIDSINSIVDITNYILIELGQPIRIFDKDQVEGGIIVRMAKEGETLIPFGGNEIQLSTDILLISDYKKALAIGGVFSSKYSSVKNQTKNIILECALFNPLVIADCVRRYGLYSEASYRYERGVDSELQYSAIERATRLLVDICGGEIGQVIDVTNKKYLPKRHVINLRRSNLNRLVGYYINNSYITDILSRLGFDIIEDQNEWQVTAPSWRFDIKNEEDLIEEIIRGYGYNNIPDKPIKIELKIKNNRESDLSLKRVKTMLNDKGYQEVITYSFVDPKIQELIHPNEKALILPNPISSKMSVMRLSLWTGLIETIIFNQNRQQNRIRIFETGLRFISDIQVEFGIRQDFMIAGAISGNRYEEHWDMETCTVDFYDVKGDLESIFDLTGKLSDIEFRVAKISALHPGQSAAIYLHGEFIGFIGVIHPELEYKLNIENRTILFELEWSKISNCVIPQAKVISRFPSNRRDIAIVVADNILASDILYECKKIIVDQVVNVNLFDVYYGKGIKKGYKSLAISLIFQDINRTLKETEITSIVNKCIKALKERFQASLRE